MTPPLISVVIPTFGRPALLRRAIASVLAQTHPAVELIVVVDGDDPPTLATLDLIDDPRVRRIVHAAPQGAGPARDAGALAAQGAWVAFLDDDDEWLPGKLARQLAAAPADGRALMMTRFRIESPEGTLVKPTRPYSSGEPIDEWLFDRHSWTKGGEAMLQTSGLMMPRALFDELRFRDTAQHEEWELAIRAVKRHGFAFVIVPEPLVIHHVTGGPALSRTYTWRRSLAWIEGLGDLVSPRAFAGFCLTVATQGLDPRRAPEAYRALLAAAFRRGRPTARQLFAFALIAAVPHATRKRLRARA